MCTVELHTTIYLVHVGTMKARSFAARSPHVQIRESMKERTACWNGIFSLAQSGEVQIRVFLLLNCSNRHIMRGNNYTLLTVSLLENLNFIDTKIKLSHKAS